MTTSPRHRRTAGYTSLLLVLSMGSLLTLLMVLAYRRAVSAQATQATVQLQLDYAEKEEAILRSIMAIVPNRAIRAMQNQSNASTTNSNPLRWENIFTEALVMANARQSISTEMLASLGTSRQVVANSGDAALGNASLIFKALGTETGFTSVGINRSLGTGYPVPLSCNDVTDSSRDKLWPILSNKKIYGTLAQSGVGLPVATYPNFNLITYPNINFGYARPGQPFVAKRNWWAFSMDLSEPDATTSKSVLSRRNFVLSIYEIPSQLPISASSFMALGQYADGDAWQNVTIAGNIFAGRAVVEGTTSLPALATRRGASLSADTTVGGQTFTGDPLAPGVREAYQLTQGDFFPVSMASESGRAAFIPINRGTDYFDRFVKTNAAETSVLSSTTWNNYSIGALQCAMRLDVTDVVSATSSPPNYTPTKLRFSYLKPGDVRVDVVYLVTAQSSTTLPTDYTTTYKDGTTVNFGTTAVDLAYGATGKYLYKSNRTGSIKFDKTTFGDPGGKAPKGGYAGYSRLSRPFEIKSLGATGKSCIAVYPKRLPGFLAALGADTTAKNNSLVVNVDYTVTGNMGLPTPAIPCNDLDYGVILQECDNLTAFTKGFSLVTNLRLYIGDDFNTVATTPPTGYTPVGLYYPPCSVFSPERRFGVDLIPFGINLSGQVDSLASESTANPIRPLDSKVQDGSPVAANRIHVNLRPITHPAELPPITMMNWLVLLEERKREFYTGN
ncbi:MAG: hypothetical protein WCO57_00610 [Verrucomicrobiota bacterium]